MVEADRSLVFFLGGRDLEMVTIRDLLAQFAPGRFHDRGLAWGAKTSAYRNEIEEALQQGCRPVLVELEDDLGLASAANDRTVVVVDHHGPRAGADRPTSLEQVFTLLGLPESEWTRRLALVAANDRGHVRAMQAIGASPEEIARVRAADRAAQGISPAEEELGRAAAARAKSHFGGRLTVVDLPHGRTATVTDALDAAAGGPGYDNLLIFCPAETCFFGSGRAIDSLQARFPGGYCGGELPVRGFWGHPSAPPPDAVLKNLEAVL